MKTKNRNAQPSTPASSAAPLVEQSEASTANEAVKLNKIAVPLNDDGSFDMETMRDKTKEKLKKAINSTPGLRLDPAGPPVSMFPPMVVVSLYRSIASIEIMLAGRIANISQPIAEEVFTFTDTELAALTPPTQRILQKYSAEWMIKYQDEITLATLLTTMTIKKVNAAIMLQKRSQSNIVEMPKKDEVDSKPIPN